MAERVYKRFYSSEPDLSFIRAFTNYYYGTDDYSTDKMKLGKMREMFEEEVHINISILLYSTYSSIN